MRHPTLTIALAAALLLGGCATPPKDGAAPPPAAAPEVTERLAPPVTVPAALARTVVLSMTGPKEVLEAKDWADFKREWRDTFADHAKEAGIAFSFVDGVAQPRGQDGTLLLVTVTDYRMIGIGSRLMFGIMTGNAYIEARVRYASLRDGTALGEQEYNTRSRASAGVFAKVTPQQVDAIAAQVFMDLKAAR